MEFPNEFKVIYYREKKPNGKRSYYVRTDTFESVYNEVVLKNLCEKVYDHDFLFGIHESIKEETLNENKYGSEHKIIFKDGRKILETYIVEIDLVFDAKAYYPNYKFDDEDYSEQYTVEYENYRSDKYQKERELKYAKWYLEIKDYKIQIFVRDLMRGNDLVTMKQNVLSRDYDWESKEDIESEFKETLNKCIDKGYIKNGKLIEPIHSKEWLKNNSPLNEAWSDF